MVEQYQWLIFWVNLNPVVGSEQSGQRPVIVISNETVNLALPVVTIASLTSLKKGRRIYPTEALLKKEESGLDRDSIVMAHQIRTISKERLGNVAGQIDSVEVKARIRQVLKLYLDL